MSGEVPLGIPATGEGGVATSSWGSSSMPTAEPSVTALATCRRNALALVIGMLICAFLFSTAIRHAPPAVLRTVRNPWLLLLTTLAVVLALFSMQKSNPSACLVLLTLWGGMLLFACTPVASEDGKVLQTSVWRALLNVVLVLSLAVLGGYITDFYARWDSLLVFALVALLITCVTFVIIPTSNVSPVSYEIFSAAGSLLFAVWTIKDVRECAGGDSVGAAVAIFIDLLNLLQFSY